MATSKKPKAMEVGVIAEDKSDVAVVAAILEKYIAPNSYVIRKFVGNGCGRLRNKCRTWTDTLFRSGCSHVLILHDRDRQVEAALRKLLLEKVPTSDFPNSAVIIPVEELEAWLLADESAISSVFSLKQRMKRVPNPEGVASPKEEIERVVWAASKKRYVNTVHNAKIAANASLESFRRCQSFGLFDDYVQERIVGRQKADA